MTRGQGLQFRVGVFIQHMGPHQHHRLRRLGGREQHVDHIHEPVVEIGVGVTQLLVGLLEQGVEAPIQCRQSLQVQRLGEAHVGCIAAVVVRVDDGPFLVALDAEAPLHRLQRPLLQRHLLAPGIVDGGHQVAYGVGQVEPALQGLAAEQLAVGLDHGRVAVLQCRQRFFLGLRFGQHGFRRRRQLQPVIGNFRRRFGNGIADGRRGRRLLHRRGRQGQLLRLLG